MHRFFLPPESLESSRVCITGDTAEQIRRVLRLRPGEAMVLLDGRGREYRAVLASYAKGEVWADVVETGPVTTEPRVRVALYLCLLNKADKYEWALQKCTELGAASFMPVVSERSVPTTLGEVRRARWARIVQEAAEQSGRGLLPELREPTTFSEALDAERERRLGSDSHLAIMPEVGQVVPLSSVLEAVGPRIDTVSFFVGPEGGFTPAETQAAHEAGVALVSLGPRILRAETAAVAGLAVLMTELGEMG